jgi:dipeptidyl aminopeptidase/acylaminoacyl peptidase
VAFSPDGSRIATAGDDRTARLWDAASGKQLAVLEGHTDSIHCVAFSPDGRRVATAGEDRTARVWDVESGKQLAVLEGHTDQVNCVVFSPDGDRIATASRDQTTRLWDPASGRSLVVLQGPGVSQLSVAFSPDGHRIATAGCNDARLWRAREIPADQEKRRRLWREQQAADAEQSGQWFSAAFHLSRLIDAEPADAALYARRAWAEVRLARWREAAEDLLRGAALQPEDDAPMPRAADGVAPGRASTRTAGVGR